MSGIKKRGMALLIGMLAVGATYAHHSSSAFDREHPVAMTGTVKQFVWANPHTWLYMEVPNKKGGSDEWVLEGPPLGMLVRKGWNGKFLKPGDKLRLTVALYKDGTKRGEFTTVRDAATGKEL
ncbi:MAG: DUF6152 family protein [Steroidobacteraceae bacterium]